MSEIYLKNERDDPCPKITIDLAGALEKITPEMMDHARDLMIETLMRRSTEMRDALKPFADCVFDNGDMTVEQFNLKREDFVRAYHAYYGTLPALGAAAPPSALPPGDGDDDDDPRPRKCRNRLRDEGKSYPRSGCDACAATIRTGLRCPHERTN